MRVERTIFGGGGVHSIGICIGWGGVCCNGWEWSILYGVGVWKWSILYWVGSQKLLVLSVLRLETIQSDSVGILYVIQNLYLVTSGA